MFQLRNIAWLVTLGSAWLGAVLGCDSASDGGGGAGGQGGCVMGSCESWQLCLDGVCVPAQGRCDTAADCAPDQSCSDGHWCTPGDGPCAGIDCSGHGTCAELEGVAQCVCHTGYDGADCESCAEGYADLGDGLCVPDPCETHSCDLHRHCELDSDSGEPTCVCDEGYVGAGCDQCDDGYFASGRDCVTEVLFALPVANPAAAMINLPVIGFDNDPAVGLTDADCENYLGQAFPYCYDQHTGSDFMLKGGFATMDAGSTEVLAAAPGEVIDAHDGEFDRCRLDLATQSVVCPGYDHVTPANYVKLRHGDGKETWYWHLKRSSVEVSVGQQVDCGDVLALVGSSGMSTAPHLHFTVVTATGDPVDPYAGPSSHPESHWVEQDGPDGLPGAACQ